MSLQKRLEELRAEWEFGYLEDESYATLRQMAYADEHLLPSED